MLQSSRSLKMLPSASIASALNLLALMSITLPAYGVKIGDTCYINSLSMDGTYIRPNFCNRLGILNVDPMRHKMYAKTSENILLICCPKASVPVKTTTTLISRPTVHVNEPLTYNPRIKGSLAEAKCKGYARISYDIKKSSMQSATSLVSQCTTKVPDFRNNMTKPTEFPHIAVLGFYDYNNTIFWYCAGTLISDSVVLTAAHCTFSTAHGNVTLVKLGASNLSENREPKIQIINVTEIIIHPQYVVDIKYHDLAILRLKHKVVYNKWVRPACLPSISTIDEGTKAITIGFDMQVKYRTRHSSVLRKSTLEIVSNKNCAISYTSFRHVYPQGMANNLVKNLFICAKEATSICANNSDGVLVIPNKNHSCMYDVIGITNMKRFCDVTPGIYIKVHNYIDWIEKTAWPEYTYYY